MLSSAPTAPPLASPSWLDGLQRSLQATRTASGQAKRPRAAPGASLVQQLTQAIELAVQQG